MAAANPGWWQRCARCWHREMQPSGRDIWLLSAQPSLYSQRESRLQQAPLHRGCNIHHFALSHHSAGPEMCWKYHFQLHHAEYWISSRLCTQSFVVYTANTTMDPDMRETRSSSLRMTPPWWDSMYRKEVKHLQVWCRENNLMLNADKIKGDGYRLPEVTARARSASVAA